MCYTENMASSDTSTLKLRISFATRDSERAGHGETGKNGHDSSSQRDRGRSKNRKGAANATAAATAGADGSDNGANRGLSPYRAYGTSVRTDGRRAEVYPV